MAKPPSCENELILNSLEMPSREVAQRFLGALATISPDGQPDYDTYVKQVPIAQQTRLRNALEQIVIFSRQPESAARKAETTVVLQSAKSDVTTQIDSAAEPAPSITIDFAITGLHPALDATLDPSAASLSSQHSQHFSWDPAGNREQPCGDLPLVDGFQILGELGRGGMGVVYRARQRGLNRLVALKMILAGGHAGAEQLQRFRAEAEAVATLKHPNIVQIYDVGERDGMPFFALEFIDGKPLDQIIAQQPQTAARTSEIVEQLARAMHYAHTLGIVHRDLKPANILMTSDGIPKITDFGLVKRLEADSGQTRTGTIMGTPSFMAPEQARGERDVGPAADTYALGSIIYALLTGRPPFMGPTALETVMMVIRSEPVPPSRMQPKLTRDLEIICLKCLQKEPAKRYATAEELASDLERFRKGEPILARPVGAPERIWRWCKRNPRVASLVGAVSLLAVILMVGGPIAAVLINEQRRGAVEARAEAEASALAARRAENVATIAQGKAEAAQKVADDNATIAGAQRQLALDTLNNVVTQVEEKLRDRAELNELRQNVLKLAMDGLENVSRTSETANFADRTIGAAHQRMGDILLRAGKADGAREQYTKALAIFEKLKDSAESDLVQWNTALTHDGLGDVSRKQLEDETIARAHYEKALECRLALETSATSPKLKPFMIRASLANSLGRISLLLLELVGDPQQSATYSERAIEKSEALLLDLPDNPIPKQALAGAWNLYAEALLRISKSETALDYAQRAMALREELRQATPASVKTRQDVAVSNWTLGDIALAEGNPTQALELYQAAFAIRLKLYQDDPQNSEMQEDLSNAYYRIGTTHLALNQAANASDSFEKCQTLRAQVLAADSDNGSKELQFLQVQARGGDGTSAAARADKLRANLFPSPGTLLRLAGIYALSSQSVGGSSPVDAGQGATTTDYQEAAVDLVKMAIERGYRDWFTLTHHPDLAALRSDPNFMKLLAPPN